MIFSLLVAKSIWRKKLLPDFWIYVFVGFFQGTSLRKSSDIKECLKSHRQDTSTTQAECLNAPVHITKRGFTPKQIQPSEKRGKTVHVTQAPI